MNSTPMTRRSRPLLALALCLGFFADAAISQPLSINLNQPTIETGQTLTFSVTGPPGTNIWMLLDLVEGQSVYPPVGTLDIAFSPLAQVYNFGQLPEDGLFVRFDEIPCYTGFGSLDVFLQVVGQDPVTGAFSKSNPVTVTIVEGDCDSECDGGIVVLGLQVDIPNVTPGLDTLEISIHKGSNDGTPGDLQAAFAEVVDLTQPVVVPLSNMTGSLVVQVLDIENDTLTIRFEIDAVLAGINKLDANTYIELSFNGTSYIETIHTSCSQPIAVGDMFGTFTITNLIDGGDGGGMGGMGM